MTRDFFPSLIIQQKWHTERRNLQIDDLVMIRDDKLVRGKWRMARITEVFLGSDGKVRKLIVS